jgi:uncharacterized protein YqfA (UPF0365 family)
MSVNPSYRDSRVAAVPRMEFLLTALTRVTVRANFDRLVGGAGEETYGRVERESFPNWICGPLTNR